MGNEHAQTLSGDAGLALPEFDVPPAEPIGVLRSWIQAAEAAGVREPLAVDLATVDADGSPSTRIVAAKGVDDRGAIVFTSHDGSRKGRDLAVNPRAAMTFYWRERLQQINVRGSVLQACADHSTALFAERPRAAQATTSVSAQSEPLRSATALRTQAAALADSGAPIPRPGGWHGYLLVIDRIEFWHGSVDRAHRRLEYVRTADDTWLHQRLQP